MLKYIISVLFILPLSANTDLILAAEFVEAAEFLIMQVKKIAVEHPEEIPYYCDEALFYLSLAHGHICIE